MLIIYSDDQLRQLIRFKCKLKAQIANKRFEDSITQYDILKAIELYNYKCFYCGDDLNGNTYQMDHFHSKAMGGKNRFDNLAPSCKWCNQMKHALDGKAFINKCKKISERNFFTKNNLEI